MKVDFNNVRRQAVVSYNKLARMLNTSICADSDMYRVIIPVRDLQRVMDGLRGEIATIALTYDETNTEIKCVLKDDETLEEFNSEGRGL